MPKLDEKAFEYFEGFNKGLQIHLPSLRSRYEPHETCGALAVTVTAVRQRCPELRPASQNGSADRLHVSKALGHNLDLNRVRVGCKPSTM